MPTQNTVNENEAAPLVSEKKKIIRIEIPHRELLEVEVGASEDRWKLICSPATWDLVSSMKKKFGGILQWPEPSGTDFSSLVVKALVRMAKGKWNPPYKDDEICHCRAVATQSVLHSIWEGANSSAVVSRWTQASTACGSCRADVLSLIQYAIGTENIKAEETK